MAVLRHQGTALSDCNLESLQSQFDLKDSSLPSLFASITHPIQVFMIINGKKQNGMLSQTKISDTSSRYFGCISVKWPWKPQLGATERDTKKKIRNLMAKELSAVELDALKTIIQKQWTPFGKRGNSGSLVWLEETSKPCGIFVALDYSTMVSCVVPLYSLYQMIRETEVYQTIILKTTCNLNRQKSSSSSMTASTNSEDTHTNTIAAFEEKINGKPNHFRHLINLASSSSSAPT